MCPEGYYGGGQCCNGMMHCCFCCCHCSAAGVEEVLWGLCVWGGRKITEVDRKISIATLNYAYYDTN